MKKETVNGTVLKVTETHIVLLTEEGMFKNVPIAKSLEVPMIGQAYTYKEKSKNNHPLVRYGAIAVALMLLVFSSLMLPFGGNAEEAFIVTIDINPSIEVAIDEQYHVIRAEGLNVDGQKILYALQLEEDLSAVMKQIIDETIKNGFIQVEEPLIATSVVPFGHDSEEVILLLTEAIHVSLEEHQVVSEVVISNEDKELYEEAKKHDLSVNYFKEFKVLEASGIVKQKEEIKGKSLAELKRMENQLRKEENEKPEQKGGNGHGSKKEHTPAIERGNSEEGKNNRARQATEKRGNQSEQQSKQKENEKQPAKSEKAKDVKQMHKDNKRQGAEKKGNANNGKGPNPSNERSGRN